MALSFLPWAIFKRILGYIGTVSKQFKKTAEVEVTEEVCLFRDGED